MSRTTTTLVFASLFSLAACAAPPAPKAPEGAAPEPAATAEAGESKAASDIVDVAVAAGKFTKLVAAVKAAGLVETLKGPGPFTVFAPTDEAFDALGDTVAELLKPESKEKLAAILKYHVVAGKVMAKDVGTMSSAKTVNGADITIKVDGAKVMINDATVVTADVAASNGVIHIIDKVILPPDAK